MPTKFADISETINLVLTVLFSVELVMKIVGYGYRFFLDSWNIFDLTIVILTISGIIISSFSNSNFGP